MLGVNRPPNLRFGWMGVGGEGLVWWLGTLDVSDCCWGDTRNENRT